MDGGLWLSEADEQAAVVEWCGYNRIPCFHIPNGGARDARTGYQLKRQGVKRGVPDLCIPVPVSGYHGLWVEMKTKTGRTTPEQDGWLELLNRNGYLATVCHGAGDAINTIDDYVNGRRQVGHHEGGCR